MFEYHQWDHFYHDHEELQNNYSFFEDELDAKFFEIRERLSRETGSRLGYLEEDEAFSLDEFFEGELDD